MQNCTVTLFFLKGSYWPKRKKDQTGWSRQMMQTIWCKKICEPRPQRLLKSLSHCNSWHTDYGWNYISLPLIKRQKPAAAEKWTDSRGYITFVFSDWLRNRRRRPAIEAHRCADTVKARSLNMLQTCNTTWLLRLQGAARTLGCCCPLTTRYE